MIQNHRIIGNKQEKDLDVAFVVPSYREGTDIINLLSSIAINGMIEGVRTGVFIVVNNSQDASQNDLESNKKTAGLIINIIRKKTSLPEYSEAIQAQILDIIYLDLNVYLVDAYTKKGAVEDCNVGYARDVGTKSALDFLKNERSIIFSTDADCELLNSWFIKELVQAFKPSQLDGAEELPSIATGHRVFVENEGEEKIFQKYNYACDLENAIYTIVKKSMGTQQLTSKNGVAFTPGSHTIFTKEVFEKIGGYEHAKGAEDVGIGMSAMREGYDIKYCPGVSISTKSRTSSRTQDGHGYGNSIRDKGDVSILEVHTHSVESIIAIETFKHQFSIAHAQFQDNRIKWIEYMYSTLKMVIPSYQQQSVEKIADIYFKYIGGKNSTTMSYPEDLFPSLFAEFKIDLEIYIAKKSLLLVLQEIDDLMDTIDSESQFFNEVIGMKSMSLNKNFLFTGDSNIGLYIDLMRLKLSYFHNINILEKFKIDYQRSLIKFENTLLSTDQTYPELGQECLKFLKSFIDLDKLDTSVVRVLQLGVAEGIIPILEGVYSHIESNIFRAYGMKTKISFLIFDIEDQDDDGTNLIHRLQAKVDKLKIPEFLKDYDNLIIGMNKNFNMNFPLLEYRIDLDLLSSDFFDSE